METIKGWLNRRRGQFGHKPLCDLQPERAPHIGNFVFPLCWRCTGIIIGCIIMLTLKWAGVHYHNMSFFIFFALPLPIDALLQEWLNIMSTNFRRLITGLLWGNALIFL